MEYSVGVNEWQIVRCIGEREGEQTAEKTDGGECAALQSSAEGLSANATASRITAALRCQRTFKYAELDIYL